jgi:hypothetical protein
MTSLTGVRTSLSYLVRIGRVKKSNRIAGKKLSPMARRVKFTFEGSIKPLKSGPFWQGEEIWLHR